MKATAKLRYLRMAPRKVRMTADLIRGKKVQDAQRLLGFAAKQSALPVLKTLNSAVASAKNNFQAEEANLYVSHVAVNEGPKLKRFRARARGSAYEIQKKTSHIIIEVDEIEQGRKAGAKKAAPAPKADAEKAPAKAPLSKPKFRPVQEESARPQTGGGTQKIFRRKSI